MSINIIINNEVIIERCNLERLMKCTMFKDIINEFPNIEEIPITFKSTEIAKNYLEDEFNNIIDPNKLCEYLQFAQFVGDEENSLMLSKKIASNISQLKSDIDLIPEIEHAILKYVPKICIAEYLFYKYPDIRKNSKDFKIDSICQRNISIDVLETYEEKEWCWYQLSCNSTITQEFIEKHINSWEWGETGLSKNPVITIEFYKKHINRYWNLTELFKNPSIAIGELLEIHINNLDLSELSSNRSITPEIVEKIYR